jgi:hypothetical protein
MKTVLEGMSRIERFEFGIIETVKGQRRWQAVGQKSELEIESLNAGDLPAQAFRTLPKPRR